MSENRSSAIAVRPTSKYGQLTMIRTTVNSRKSRKYSPGTGLFISHGARRRPLFVGILLAIGLTGCAGAAGFGAALATPSLPRDAGQAKSENMVTQKDVCPTCNSNNRFAEKIQIDEVQGGREPGELPARGSHPGVEVPDEAFRSALEQSLRNNGLLAENASHARFILNTHLIELGGGRIGGVFDATRYSVIRYVLRDEQTGEQVGDELVETRFTEKFSDTLRGRTRSRKAVEGSIRENIRQFVILLLTEFKPRTIKSSVSSSEGRGSRER